MKKIYKKRILASLLLLSIVLSVNARKVIAADVACGTYIEVPATGMPNDFCACTNFEFVRNDPDLVEIEWWCCGWYYNNNCNAQPILQPTPTPIINLPSADEDFLNNINPLRQFSSKADQLSTPGGIISEILRFAFPIAGMILFVVLIMAGLKMLTGATNSKNMEEGKQMITTAILGFIILFAAYWIAQLLEIIFGIIIL